MYGPQRMLPVALRAWAQACETNKLEAARAVYFERQATLQDQMSENFLSFSDWS
jgi:hypothetical protein